MVEGLGLSGGERVLEVGSGYGWQTALLARLAGQVLGVERWSDLAASAASNLQAAGIEGWQLVVGDGTAGLPEHAPFDAILVSAAFPRVPEPLTEQLAEGGRLVQPIGRGGNEQVVSFERVGGQLLEHQLLSAAHFVRLVGRHAFAP
jgi:protein-L-isoaspartate(D-aspartate) O-methyltransferase